MQEDQKKETPAASVVPAGGKPPPGFCGRLQRAFHARPAFRPLRRLTVRHQVDGAAGKPADAGDGGAAPTAEPARKHGGGPPVPAPPRPLTPSPSPRRAPDVRLPALTATRRRSNMPTALPVPAPPKDVVTGVPVAADPKASVSATH